MVKECNSDNIVLCYAMRQSVCVLCTVRSPEKAKVPKFFVGNCALRHLVVSKSGSFV